MRKTAFLAFCIIICVFLSITSFGADITSETTFYATFRPYPFSTSVSMQSLPSSGQLLSGSTGANALGIAVKLPSDTVLTNGTTLYYTYKVSMNGASPVQFTSQGLFEGVDYGNFASTTFTKSGQIPEDRILRSFTYTSATRDGAIVTVAIPVVDGYLAYMDIMHTTVQSNMIFVTVYEPLVTYGGASEEILNRMNDIVLQLQAQGASIEETNRKLDNLQQSIDNQLDEEFDKASDKIGYGLDEFDIGFSEDTLNDMPAVSAVNTLLGLVTTGDTSSVIQIPKGEINGTVLWDSIAYDLGQFEQYPFIAYLHTALKLLTWLGCFVLLARMMTTAISCVSGERSYTEVLKAILTKEVSDIKG